MTHEPEQIASIGAIFAATFAPALAWMGYWIYRARLGPGGVRPALILFAAGLLAGPIALGLFTIFEAEPFFEQLSAIDEASDTRKLIFALIAIGPVEELSKFLVVWGALTLSRWRLDPLLGGPLFSSAAALGFASIENWYYMLEVEQVIWHRAITLPFNHVLFSSFWGVGLSLYRSRPKTGVRWLTAGLTLSMVYHGLYDYIVLSELAPTWLVAPLMLGLWIWFVLAIPRIKQSLGHLAPSD